MSYDVAFFSETSKCKCHIVMVRRPANSDVRCDLPSSFSRFSSVSDVQHSVNRKPVRCSKAMKLAINEARKLINITAKQNGWQQWVEIGEKTEALSGYHLQLVDGIEHPRKESRLHV